MDKCRKMSEYIRALEVKWASGWMIQESKQRKVILWELDFIVVFDEGEHVKQNYKLKMEKLLQLTGWWTETSDKEIYSYRIKNKSDSKNQTTIGEASRTSCHIERVEKKEVINDAIRRIYSAVILSVLLYWVSKFWKYKIPNKCFSNAAWRYEWSRVQIESGREGNRSNRWTRRSVDARNRKRWRRSLKKRRKKKSFKSQVCENR